MTNLILTASLLFSIGTGDAGLSQLSPNDPSSDPVELAAAAIHNSCGGAGVEGWLDASHSFTNAAAKRLDQLAALSDAKRASAWNAGAEKVWFGSYTESRFKNVRKRMRSMATILSSWRLDVKCNWKKSYYGNASPGIHIMTLGSAWKNESSSNVNKVQTFVHEAAHIAGAVLGGEVLGKYEVGPALARAKKNPGVAVRTAENLGYYATCRSSKWVGKGGCP